MDRFWDKVDKTGDCWEWRGSKGPDGYGRFYLNGKTVYAHRFSYGLDSLKGDDCVLHRCDNPGCVNPEHLFKGTQLDNIRDRDQKGRQVAVRGSEQHLSKLLEEDVVEIRSLKHVISQRQIAQMFGVSHASIGAIHRGETWAHI